MSFTCIVAAQHRRPSHVKPGAAEGGIDVGVRDLIVLADPGGNELERHRAPREFKAAQRKLRALQRKAARQVGAWDQIDEAQSSNRRRPGNPRSSQISRVHARVANLRADRIHKLTTPDQPNALGDRHRDPWL